MSLSEDARYRLIQLLQTRANLTLDEVKRSVTGERPPWAFRKNPIKLSSDDPETVVSHLGPSAEPIMSFLNKKDLQALKLTTRELKDKVEQYRTYVKTRKVPAFIPIGPLQGIFKHFRFSNDPNRTYRLDFGQVRSENFKSIQSFAVFDDSTMIVKYFDKPGFFSVRQMPVPDPFKYRERTDNPLPPLVMSGDPNAGQSIMSTILGSKLLDYFGDRDLDSLSHVNKEMNQEVKQHIQFRNYKPTARSFQNGIQYKHLARYDRWNGLQDDKISIFRTLVYHESPVSLKHFVSNGKGDFFATNGSSIWFIPQSTYIPTLIAGDSTTSGNQDGPAPSARWTDISRLCISSRGLVIISAIDLDRSQTQVRISLLDLDTAIGTVTTLLSRNQAARPVDEFRDFLEFAATNDAIYMTYKTSKPFFNLFVVYYTDKNVNQWRQLRLYTTSMVLPAITKDDGSPPSLISIHLLSYHHTLYIASDYERFVQSENDRGINIYTVNDSGTLTLLLSAPTQAVNTPIFGSNGAIYGLQGKTVMRDRGVPTIIKIE